MKTWIRAGLLFFSACASSSDGGKARQCLAPAPAVELLQPEVSFRTTVFPIVEKNCALSACHADAKLSLGIFLPNDPAQVYKAMHAPATSNLKLDFVKAGAPADSFLMHKLDGTHCALDADCLKGACGQEMPPGGILGIDERTAIRRWIAQGATDN